MKKTLRIVVAAFMVGLLSGPQFSPSLFAAASGNYTDLLPIGAAGNTTVISNGSGWSLTTLPPTQTFGDSLSRLVDTVYQSTITATINATTTASTMTAISAQGFVGSTTFPAAWVVSGRSIEVDVLGDYSVPQVGSNWTWAILLGTTSVVTTGAVAAVPGQTKMPFHGHAVLTIAATGNAGSVNASYEVLAASNTTPNQYLSWSTGTISGATTVDLTSQLTVNPVFTWGTANSSMTIRNAVVKFLN